MNHLIANREFINSMIRNSDETKMNDAFWMDWWLSPVKDSYDAMGVCLMGGEL